MEGGSEDVKPNQERRLKSTQGDDQQQHQPQQPQKCPRCESLNTKFCYYNNYNLSQPRYFCKTCRRYWTLGGTLRNVPVGGGCRKGKRAKTSSSSSSGENSRLQQQLPQQPHLLQHHFATPQNILATNNSGNLSSPALRNKESGNLVSPPAPGMSTMGSYFPGGGFFTSLEAIQSLNNNQPPIQSFPLQPLNQPVNLGGVLGETSNLGLLHGFNAVPAFGSQNQQQSQFNHVGYRDTRSIEHSFYPHNQESLIQSSRPATSSHQQQNWHHGFMSNSSPTVSDTALWSTSTSTTIGHTNSNINPTAGSSPLNQDQWKHDLPGYGPPS